MRLRESHLICVVKLEEQLYTHHIPFKQYVDKGGKEKLAFRALEIELLEVVMEKEWMAPYLLHSWS